MAKKKWTVNLNPAKAGAVRARVGAKPGVPMTDAQKQAELDAAKKAYAADKTPANLTRMREAQFAVVASKWHHGKKA
jgi:hypothetical protein